MKGGVSDTLSPKTIWLAGETLDDYKKHLRLQIGQYCQVHEEDTPRNSQHPRTKGAARRIEVHGFEQHMKENYSASWDVIPMPDTVIAHVACVNTLGSDQPEQLIFTNRYGGLIGDTDTDTDIP